MNGIFSRSDDAIRYHLNEGFSVGDARCKGCAYVWQVIVHTDTCRTRLQCPKCANVGNWFTGFIKVPP